MGKVIPQWARLCWTTGGARDNLSRRWDSRRLLDQNIPTHEVSCASQFRSVKNLGHSAQATLQLPVWNWGASRSRLRQASLRRQQARVELSFAQRQLLSSLRTFHNEAQTARSELESLSRSAEMAAESLRLTTLRYQSGEATVLEVVDAQNTLTLARNAYDEGQARFRLAVPNLQTLTGSF